MRVRGGLFLPLSLRKVIFMVKCKYHADKRCYHSSCSFIDVMGNVVVCPLHGNPLGRCMRKVSVPSRNVSLWNKHLRGGS